MKMLPRQKKHIAITATDYAGRTARKPVRIPISPKQISAICFGILLAVGISLFGYVSKNLLGKSDFFQVTSIMIEGCTLTSKAEILALSGVDIHSNLLALDQQEIERQISSNQWVAAVEVRKRWPNLLNITVHEKKPVALINIDNSLRYLDQRGVAFAPVEPGHELDYPVISGINADMLAGEGQAAPQLMDMLSFLQCARRGSSFLPLQNISEIKLGSDGSLIVYLLEKPFPIYLGDGNAISKKYYRLAEVLKDLYRNKEFARTSSIQMDYLGKSVLVSKSDAG